MYNSFIVGQYSPFIQSNFLNTKGWRSTMKSWSYTNNKKMLELCFRNNDFMPSIAYTKGQSPFNPTKSYPYVSTWDIWFDAIANSLPVYPTKEQILVQYNIEAVLLLIEDFYVPPSQITLLSDNDNKTSMAQSWGVRVVTDQKELENMQFTHTLKNPPWDGGIYTKFWPSAHNVLVDQGLQVDILPTNWMTLSDFSKDRQYLLKNFEILSIQIYDNSKRQVFEAQPGGEVVVMISRKCATPNNQLVEFRYFNEPAFTVDLTRHDIWPLYTSALSVKIFDMVVSKKINDLKWYTKGEITKNATPFFISAPTKVHARVSPNFMKTPGSAWELNKLKGIADEQQFFFDTNASASLHHEWFSTDEFSFVLAMAKSQGKNQPHPISYLGEHNFTNNDFSGYFGFTQAHLDEIARWKSSK
jgi:hypothetical protein